MQTLSICLLSVLYHQWYIWCYYSRLTTGDRCWWPLAFPVAVHSFSVSFCRLYLFDVHVENKFFLSFFFIFILFLIPSCDRQTDGRGCGLISKLRLCLYGPTNSGRRPKRPSTIAVGLYVLSINCSCVGLQPAINSSSKHVTADRATSTVHSCDDDIYWCAAV